jgi:hypothetical protein
MEISWPTVGISFAVSACTGGLAGAIFTRFASVGLQRKILQAQARASAIKLVSDWISVVYDLYWTNESTYAGSSRPPDAKSSLNHSTYRTGRSSAEMAVKTHFGPAEYANFKQVGDWIEKALSRAYANGEPLSFEEFHRKHDELLCALHSKTW